MKRKVVEIDEMISIGEVCDKIQSKLGVPKYITYKAIKDEQYETCRKIQVEKLFSTGNSSIQTTTINFDKSFKETYNSQIKNHGLDKYRDDIMYAMKRIDTGLVNKQAIELYIDKHTFEEFSTNVYKILNERYKHNEVKQRAIEKLMCGKHREDLLRFYQVNGSNSSTV